MLTQEFNQNKFTIYDVVDEHFQNDNIKMVGAYYGFDKSLNDYIIIKYLQKYAINPIEKPYHKDYSISDEQYDITAELHGGALIITFQNYYNSTQHKAFILENDINKLGLKNKMELIQKIIENKWFKILFTNVMNIYIELMINGVCKTFTFPLHFVSQQFTN